MTRSQNGMQTNYRNSISAGSSQRSNRQTKTRQQFNRLTESLDLAGLKLETLVFGCFAASAGQLPTFSSSAQCCMFIPSISLKPLKRPRILLQLAACFQH